MILHVTFSEGQKFTPIFECSDAILDLDFGSSFVIGTSDPYEGDYEVTPSDEEHILACKDLLMTDNVTVHEIPYSEVGSPVGGYVAVIA